MNKAAKVTLYVFAISSLIAVVGIIGYAFALSTITNAADGTTSFAAVNEDASSFYNVSVYNNETSINVTIVNITLPSGFTFTANTNGTDAGDHSFSSPGSLLVWNNSIGLVQNESTNTFFFNATASHPGDYNFTVRAGNATNVTTTTISVTINDITAPNVSAINNPLNFGNISGTVTMNATVSDNLAVDSVYFNLTNSSGDQLNFTIGTQSQDDYTASLDTTSLGDGDYNITVFANDTTDNLNNTVFVQIVVDNTEPETADYQGDTETDGANLSRDNIVVNVTASDSGSGLDTILIDLFDSSGSNVGNVSNSTAPVAFANFTGLADGLYTFNATVNDTAENVNFTSSRTVRVDTTVGNLSFTSPADGANISGSSLNVSVTAADAGSGIDTITIRIYDTAVSNVTPIGSSTSSSSPFSLTNTSLSDGFYAFNATLNDSAGNVNNSATRTAYVGIPELSFVSSVPADGANVTSASITLNMTSNDTSDHYVISDFDNDLILWMRMDDNSGSTVTDLSSHSNNGTTGVTINATGYFGDAAWFDGTIAENITVSQDDSMNLTTEITVAAWIYPQLDPNSTDNYTIISKPGDGVGVQNRSFEIIFTEDSSHRIQLELSNSSGSDASVITEAAPDVSLNTWTHIIGTYNGTTLSIYKNGEHNNYSTAISGNMELNINDLFIGARNSSDQTFTGAIDEVLIFNRTLDATEIEALYNASATATQYDHTFTDLGEGSHTFSGHAVDMNGNRNDTVTRTVDIDFPPQVTINNPTATTYDASDFPLTINVTLNENASVVEYTINGGSTNFTLNSTTAFNESTSYNGTLSQPSDGTHTFRIYANDTAGVRNDTETVQFTVDTSSGSTTNGGSDGGDDDDDFTWTTVSKDDEDLSDLSPIYILLDVARRVKLNVSDEEHFVGVVDIDTSDEEATINVSSEHPRQEVFSIDESHKYDLLEDGFYDLQVTLTDITDDNDANLTLLYLHEEIEEPAPEPVCGDGMVEGSEACDDGNTDNEDGCSSSCQVEEGWTCDDSEPSSCTEEVEEEGGFFSWIGESFERSADLWILWIVVVILAAGVGVWYYFARKRYMEHMKSPKGKTDAMNR